jgi:hypothetical protein
MQLPQPRQPAHCSTGIKKEEAAAEKEERKRREEAEAEAEAEEAEEEPEGDRGPRAAPEAEREVIWLPSMCSTSRHTRGVSCGKLFSLLNPRLRPCRRATTEKQKKKRGKEEEEEEGRSV